MSTFSPPWTSCVLREWLTVDLTQGYRLRHRGSRVLVGGLERSWFGLLFLLGIRYSGIRGRGYSVVKGIVEVYLSGSLEYPIGVGVGTLIIEGGVRRVISAWDSHALRSDWFPEINKPV